MSDEKKYTERELRGCQRLAYVHGWRDCWPTDGRISSATENARRKYPPPRVTRSRVVVGPAPRTWNWKFEAGAYWFRATSNGSWERANPAWEPDPDLVTLWADLLANPTEEVEE